jgi:two-component system, chemotaxis family, protein-glutamate methylesterase/glutaminase
VKGPVRVLVADDSATVRAVLVALLSADPGIVVAGEARDGLEVVRLAKELHPDVITMDIRMPHLGGLEAIAAIMAESPSRILVIAAVDDDEQVDLSFRAVGLGALELIAKPRDHVGSLRPWGLEVCEAVHWMAEVPVVRRRAQSAPDRGRYEHRRIDVLGVVASTGGPPALAALLAEWPRDLPVPVLVAQHIGPGFGEGLVRWLASVTALRVVVAREGVACRPGHVYLPPDGSNLAVDDEGLLRMSRGGDLHCPSADHLLESIAGAYGPRGGALVLTGMGDDGANGVSAVLRRGGVAFAQDEASSVVYGMPRAAALRGAFQVPFLELAKTIRDLCVSR